MLYLPTQISPTLIPSAGCCSKGQIDVSEINVLFLLLFKDGSWEHNIVLLAMKTMFAYPDATFIGKSYSYRN